MHDTSKLKRVLNSLKVSGSACVSLVVEGEASLPNISVADVVS